MALALVLLGITFPYTYPTMAMGPAGFEPATSSARGWHPAKLDNGPKNCTVSGCNPYYMSINMRG